MSEWTCPTCGEVHSELPLCFGAAPPWRALVPEAEFDSRVELTMDQCVVDGSTFFVRGQIEIPIIGTEEALVFSVWCSLSERSFLHMTDRWTEPERAGDSYFGWLCSPIPVYPSTIHLKTNVRSRAVGVVPLVEVQECDHPLWIDQRDGITVERAHRVVEQLLHR